MKSNEMYGAIFLAGMTAFASWVFSCEVLFIMGIIITILLATLVGMVLGSIALSERVSLARDQARARARAEWSVRARTSTMR